LFFKFSGRAGTASREKLTAPTDAGNFKFVGNNLVGVFPQVSGATQVTVTFDSAYQSCHADVVTGVEAGRPFAWTNLNGVRCTSTGKPTISGVSCSVSQGNVFAN
jgi:hypothetical protein